MDQSIGFCRSEDGVRLAYASTGDGPPMVKAANYLTHLQLDWTGPVWGHWLRALSTDGRLIRYDERGCGLSDRIVHDISLDAWVRDLRAVVDELALDRFTLFGVSQGAAVSVAYAVANPDRVKRLVLYGGYARGRFHRAVNAQDRLRADTMINAIRVGWDVENPAFRQLFSTMLVPDGNESQWNALNELARRSTSPEIAAQMEEAFDRIDVTSLATRVTTPTLVLHARGDARTPVEEGRLLAGLIPGARFVELDSRNHVLQEHEPAWSRFLDEVRSFVHDREITDRDEEDDAPAPDVDATQGTALQHLTPRERQVLAWVGTGSSNDEIAERLHISPKTARNHVSRIYAKLRVERRAQAVVVARDAGLRPMGSRSSFDRDTSR